MKIVMNKETIEVINAAVALVERLKDISSERMKDVGWRIELVDAANRLGAAVQILKDGEENNDLAKILSIDNPPNNEGVC